MEEGISLGWALRFPKPMPVPLFSLASDQAVKLSVTASVPCLSVFYHDGHELTPCHCESLNKCFLL